MRVRVMWLVGLFFLGVSMAQAATITPPAQNQISNEQAVRYYTECRDKKNAMSGYSPEQHQAFCTCTTVRMKQSLTLDDVRNMQNTATPAGRAALAKMLVQVHFPCAFPPIEESIRAECLVRSSKNPKFAAGGIKYCGCLAQKTMAFVKTQGVRSALETLQKTGQVGEPMDVLVQSGDYNAALVKNYYTCFNGVLP